MRSVIIFVVLSFGAPTLSQQRNAFEIDKLLDYLSQRESSVKNADVFNKIRNQPERFNKPDDNDEIMSNLLEIQSPNYRYKNVNARGKNQFQKVLEQALREESDKTCRETGRCGCNGGRCGSHFNSDDSPVNDVERLLKDIENILNRDDQLDKGNNLDYDTNKDDKEPNLKRIANNFQTDNNLKIAFLDEPDLNDKRVMSRLHNLADDVKIVDLRNFNLENILHHRKPSDGGNRNTLRSSDTITPEDFNKYYEQGRRMIVRDLTDYVKARKYSIFATQLSTHQRTLLDAMKKKHTEDPIHEDDLRQELTDLVFGTHSAIHVVPQSKDLDIHVPDNLYKALQQFKMQDNLRAKKSILPLTLQQKSRMKEKVSSKTLPKLTWRRNMQPRDKYGVPFHLDIQGLGQFNN